MSKFIDKKKIATGLMAATMSLPAFGDASSSSAAAAAAAAAGNNGDMESTQQVSTGDTTVEGDELQSRALGLSLNTADTYGDLPSLNAARDALISRCSEEANSDDSYSVLGGYLFKFRFSEASRTAGSEAYGVPIIIEDENGNRAEYTSPDGREYLDMDTRMFTEATRGFDKEKLGQVKFSMCFNEGMDQLAATTAAAGQAVAAERQHELDLVETQGRYQAFSTGFGHVVDGYYDQQINKDTQEALNQRTAIEAGVELAINGPTDHVSATNEAVVLRQQPVYGQNCNALGFACDRVVIGYEEVPVATSVANMNDGTAGGADQKEHRRAWSIATTGELLVQQGIVNAEQVAEARQTRQQQDLQVADHFLNRLPTFDQ